MKISMILLVLYYILPSILKMDEAVPTNTLINVTKSIPYNDEYERNIQRDESEKLEVSYEVMGNDIYVQCHCNDFTFMKGMKTEKEQGQYLQLSINGNIVDRFHTPSFIVKNLPLGTHYLKIEAIQNGQSIHETNKIVLIH